MRPLYSQEAWQRKSFYPSAKALLCWPHVQESTEKRLLVTLFRIFPETEVLCTGHLKTLRIQAVKCEHS